VRVAVLYDIHGNLPALDAVLAEVRAIGVDEIVIGGDVLPGPMPRECLDRLFGLTVPVRFIRGNGDRESVAHRAGGGTATLPDAVRAVLRWTGGRLDDALSHSIAAWPLTLSMDLPGIGAVLFCHATTRNDTEIFTKLTPEVALLPVFGNVDAALLACGHTHMPFDRTVGRLRVVNPGSVGMPFGEPGAHWVLLSTDRPTAIEWRHTRYDLPAAAARIRATDYPQAADFAANNVLNPPTEAAMLEALGRSAIR
jgi:putative phosphoesterase